MRLRAGILSVATAVLVALGCGAPSALAAAPPDMLSGNEYALLSAARLGLDSALSERQPNWVAAAQDACLTATFRSPTPLLVSQKASCLGTVKLRALLAVLGPDYNRCAKRGRKGETVCRAPLYKQLARDAASAYRGDLKAQRAIRKRGFTGACLTALGSTRAALGDEHKLATSTRKLSVVWRLLAEIAKGRITGNKLKQSRIDRDTRIVRADINRYFRHYPANDLSGCPHQMP